MRNIPALLSLCVIIFGCNRQNNHSMSEVKSNSIFPLGDVAHTEHFTGEVHAKILLSDDSLFQCSIFSVTFEKGARTNWHKHPSGQILLVLEGEGLHQIKGEPIQVIRKGEVAFCPPNIEHWHGASPHSRMNHVAINPNTERGLVEWKERVTDSEYANFKTTD